MTTVTMKAWIAADDDGAIYVYTKRKPIKWQGEYSTDLTSGCFPITKTEAKKLIGKIPTFDDGPIAIQVQLMPRA